jgi:hypothetical protein
MGLDAARSWLRITAQDSFDRGKGALPPTQSIDEEKHSTY